MRHRLLAVRRVAAVPAPHNEVLARLRLHHEFVRLAPSHRARMRFHDQILQTAPLEDAAISVEVLPVGYVQPRRIHIKGVGILHDELAYAQQPRFRPRFIAKLGLDLIPDLRHLFVAAQLAARGSRNRFLVRHAQT